MATSLPSEVQELVARLCREFERLQKQNEELRQLNSAISDNVEVTRVAGLSGGNAGASADILQKESFVASGLMRNSRSDKPAPPSVHAPDPALPGQLDNEAPMSPDVLTEASEASPKMLRFNTQSSTQGFSKAERSVSTAACESRATSGSTEGARNVLRGSGAIGQFRDEDDAVATASKQDNNSEHVRKPITLENVVRSNGFDLVLGLLIFANCASMAVERQFVGIDYAHSLGQAEKTRLEYWPECEDFFYAFDMFFGVIFTIELTLKMIVEKKEWYKSPWNYLDAVIVFLWILEKAFAGIMGSLNPMMLRLVRLFKLLRLAKMVRTIQAFDSLNVLIGSIQAGVSVLFWSSALLFLVQMGIALFFNSMLGDFIADDEGEYPNSTPDRTRRWYTASSSCSS
jgi:hypothetical protein